MARGNLERGEFEHPAVIRRRSEEHCERIKSSTAKGEVRLSQLCQPLAGRSAEVEEMKPCQVIDKTLQSVVLVFSGKSPSLPMWFHR